MKKSIIAIISATLALCQSCQLVQPADVENPNVVEEDFLASSGAMKAWVNGANATFAFDVSRFCEYTELLSDNYYNNYTRSSKTFDQPSFSFRSGEVSTLSTYVGKLIETASYGIGTVAKADKETTDAQLFNLYYIKAYAHILAGENFVALPLEANGEVKDWKTQLQTAISTLTTASSLAADADSKALVNTLMARAYRGLGDRQNAASYARKALEAKADFEAHVTFDGENGVSNSINEYLGSYMFQPLPRLDFLDPKYPYSTYWNAPIYVAKAEEDHLILAEAAIAEGKLDEARTQLKSLISLVASRPQQLVDDTPDERNNGGTMVYPNSTDYLVRASADDEARSGLTRKHGKSGIPYYVSTVSGTSVTPDMIDSATTHDALLEIVYLMRQEIFIAEGRRSSDLGIRMPLSEVEAARHSDLPESYTQNQIPSFIPLNGGLDAFTIDREPSYNADGTLQEAGLVTIKYNMNKVLVQNRTSEFVVPFE